METTQEEAQKLINILKAKFPKKETYFKKQINFAKLNGYIITDDKTNSRSYFNKFKELKELENIPYDEKTKKQSSDYYKLKGNLERMAQNYPIQGCSGMMTKYAAILFEREILKNNLDGFIVNMVHDELVVDCNFNQRNEIKEIVV